MLAFCVRKAYIAGRYRIQISLWHWIKRIKNFWFECAFATFATSHNIAEKLVNHASRLVLGVALEIAGNMLWSSKKKSLIFIFTILECVRNTKKAEIIGFDSY
jgi:hypothetical protein